MVKKLEVIGRSGLYCTVMERSSIDVPLRGDCIEVGVSSVKKELVCSIIL